MIPKGVDFDIKDGKESNGDGKLQKTFTDTMNQELSVIVLGNTETTTNGQTGSQAKSKVHKEQQDEISKSDLFYLSSWLNSPQFLLILKSYGYDVEGGRFEHTREISIEYLAQRIAIDIQLPEDLPIPDDYWYETYGIEKPANYAELKKKLEDKQKMLQAANDIKNDPENKPAKAPAKTPSKKELKKLIAQYNRSIGGNQPAIEPLGSAGIKKLFRKVLSFFD
jgi:phage gp29-like protein